MKLSLDNSNNVETVVQLSKGDIDGHVSSEKKAVKSEASEIISGYRKGNRAPETTNVKIDFPWIILICRS